MIYQLRRLIALPFKMAACVFIVVAFMISAENGADTLGKWCKREMP